MKTLKFLAVCLLMFSTLLSLFSCGSNSNANTSPEATTPQEPPQININVGSDVTLPSIDKDNLKFADAVKLRPSKEGFVFAGWYSDENLTDYIIPDHITATQYSKGTLYPKWIEINPITCAVRADVATITDSGRSKQKMDIAFLDSLNITDLKRAGYTKLHITVSYDVREVNDGSQYVFLYQDKNCAQPKDEEGSLADMIWGDSLDGILGNKDPGDPTLLYTHKGEHGSGKKDSSWATQSFTLSLSIDDIIDHLYIRYGASGKDEDTWECKNIFVTVTPMQ